ncbi:MAG: anaerobic ribonucleoside-triphosphate reductase activating protein [Bacillota bacterium]
MDCLNKQALTGFDPLKKIRLYGIVEESYVDGTGIRFTIFTQGCFHNCRGCHNENSHDPAGGYEVELLTICNQIAENPLLDGITLSGGEPFLQAEACAVIARHCKETLGLTVWAYTGYLFEELLEMENAEVLLKEIDVLVDGKFIEEFASYELVFRGSKNQRIIDVKQSLATGAVVEMELNIAK